MNSRKKFLVQGTLATTALFVANPFKGIANKISPLSGFSTSENKLVITHTSNSRKLGMMAKEKASDIKRNTGNVLMVHAGEETTDAVAELPYDASVHLGNSVLANDNNYKIVYKGKLKIGVITALQGGGIISSTEILAAYLKNVKNCQLVVCLSQLGYKNKNAADDITLAESTANVDVIISGHATNVLRYPMVVRNTNKEEVIIHAATENGFALGNIEIDFAADGTKKNINFNNLLSRV